MPPAITAAVLHLSDLHLGKDPDDYGSRWKSSGLNWRSVVNFFVNRGTVLQCHDSYIFNGLGTEIYRVARTLGVPGDAFEFHVATGDISTDVDPAERFDFARRYLTGRVRLNDSWSPGLDLNGGNLFCVPGNHDKMKRRNLAHYRASFDALPQPLPYVHEAQARSGQRFVFFGIDSNLYDKRTIARGLFDPATFGWLGENIERYGRHDGPDKPVRILLLHHHVVDLNQFTRQSRLSAFKRSVEGRYTLLNEADRLLGLCKDRVDIIMHGHEHFPIVLREPKSGCVVISAGTTSEFQPNKEHHNSLHAVLFHGRRFEVVRFDWKRASSHFLSRLSWSGDLDAPGEALRHAER